MIIRHIKLARQDRIIHEQIQEQDQEYLDTPRQNNKTTLNPELPISETIISNQHQHFLCEPSEPLYHNNPIIQNERKLSIQQPLSIDQFNEQTSQTKEVENLNKYKKLRQCRMEKSINHSIRPNNKAIYNIRSLPMNQNEQKYLNKKQIDNHKQRSFKKYQLILPEVSQIKQIQESLLQNRTQQQQENKILRSKFTRSNFRNRLSQTLNKFQMSKDTKQENKKERYSFSFSQQPKTSKLSKTTTANSYKSDSNSQQAVLQHFKNKAQSSNRKKINKRLLPQNIETPDQQFSTIFGKSEPPKVSDSQEQISPKTYFQEKNHPQEKIVISYKTTLLELKQMCCQKNIEYQQIVMMIPGPLSSIKFYPEQGQQEIFTLARKILNQMNINSTSINIKRYSNCVIIISGNIGIISLFGGRIYIGGWISNQKIGLGLQWFPGKYIYYGQFKNNKREGVGIFKGAKGGTAAGKWVDNTFYGPLYQQPKLKLAKKTFLSHDFEDQ